MDDFLTTENIIIALGSVGAFLTIVAFGLPMLGGDNLQSRLKVVAARREELGQAQRQKYATQASSLRQQTGRSYVTFLVEKLKLVNPAESEGVRNMLARAGMRNQAHLYTYSFFRFVAPIIFGLFTAIYLFLLAKVELDVSMKLVYSFAAAVIGFFLPQILIKNKIANRQKSIQKVFPDALDLMVICIEAGLSMEASFGRVAEELQEQGPELSEELGLTTAELAFLPDRRQALMNFSDRTGLPSVKSLVTALAQAEKYGTPISVSLKVLSQESRDERMSKAEQKAGALPAQLTVPMIAFFLPVLFVVLIGPAIIKTMNTLE
ncbi:MAG: type II secretion system F family protein [Alphaproteobacteria bacterium]|jgi:tight adherence protein C|nr:type II secretion system F family protein [Alphaproteobacteria bacterium]MDP6815553.1 type II secretion system F family protein [Alphaproteobacteria bacterium]